MTLPAPHNQEFADGVQSTPAQPGRLVGLRLHEAEGRKAHAHQAPSAIDAEVPGVQVRPAAVLNHGAALYPGSLAQAAGEVRPAESGSARPSFGNSGATPATETVRTVQWCDLRGESRTNHGAMPAGAHAGSGATECGADSFCPASASPTFDLSRAQLARDVTATHEKYLAVLAALLALAAVAVWSCAHWRTLQLADGSTHAAAADWRGA